LALWDQAFLPARVSEIYAAQMLESRPGGSAGRAKTTRWSAL